MHSWCFMTKPKFDIILKGNNRILFFQAKIKKIVRNYQASSEWHPPILQLLWYNFLTWGSQARYTLKVTVNYCRPMQQLHLHHIHQYHHHRPQVHHHHHRHNSMLTARFVVKRPLTIRTTEELLVILAKLFSVAPQWVLPKNPKGAELDNKLVSSKWSEGTIVLTAGFKDVSIMEWIQISSK